MKKSRKVNPEKYKNLDINELNKHFISACIKGKLEIVKYLLTSPELKDNGIDFANVHAQDDFAFISACGAGHWEVIKYLIADHRIAMTTNIETYLSREDVINFVGNDNVLNMFAVINNYEKLNQNLTTHFSTKKVNNKI